MASDSVHGRKSRDFEMPGTGTRVLPTELNSRKHDATDTNRFEQPLPLGGILRVVTSDHECISRTPLLGLQV